MRPKPASRFLRDGTLRVPAHRGRHVELVEVAPGIDPEKDIFPLMSSSRSCATPDRMNPLIFKPEPMGLEQLLLGISLAERITYDPARNTIFINFEGFQVRTTADVDLVRREMETRCKAIGHKVALVANYDGFYLDPNGQRCLFLDGHLHAEPLLLSASRYTTSAFMRLKLGAGLAERNLAPHVFETWPEAQAFSAARLVTTRFSRKLLLANNAIACRAIVVQWTWPYGYRGFDVSPVSARDRKPEAGLEPDRTGTIRGLSLTGFHDIAYVDWGPLKASPPVICVHGLSRQGRDFDYLAADLAAAGRRVICPDLVGRGHSGRLRDPDEYALPQYCADMNALIARLGVEEVDWVGTSLGGLIGIVLAGLPENPIRRLVINDIGPYLPWAGLARIGSYVSAMPTDFHDPEEAEAYFREVLAPFGDLPDAHWAHITRHSISWNAEPGALRDAVRPADRPRLPQPLALQHRPLEILDRDPNSHPGDPGEPVGPAADRSHQRHDPPQSPGDRAGNRRLRPRAAADERRSDQLRGGFFEFLARFPLVLSSHHRAWPGDLDSRGGAVRCLSRWPGQAGHDAPRTAENTRQSSARADSAARLARSSRLPRSCSTVNRMPKTRAASSADSARVNPRSRMWSIASL